jgi:hypothetical protein
MKMQTPYLKRKKDKLKCQKSKRQAYRAKMVSTCFEKRSSEGDKPVACPRFNLERHVFFIKKNIMMNVPFGTVGS